MFHPAILKNCGQLLFQKTILEVQGLCETASSVSEDDYLYSKRQKRCIIIARLLIVLLTITSTAHIP